ncbi:F-type conjugative transfer protein TrbC [Klebsiella aerogenes]
MFRRQNAIQRHLVRRQVHGNWLERYVIQPFTVQLVLIAGIIAGFLYPATLLLSLPAGVVLLIAFSDQRFRLPLRIPKDVGGLDFSTEREIRKGFPTLHLTWRAWRYSNAEGIMCLGSGRQWELGKELWLTMADCLRHMMVMATTGGGKTETMYTMFLNAICWARGCVIGDGKATTELVSALWGLCRRFGREDDLYVMNFITGGHDRFKALVGGDKSRAQTNSSSPFAHSTATFIIQLMESLMPASGGSDEGWKDKARAMMNALIFALCYKRSRDGIVLTQAVIQSYLPLRKMVGLYKEALNNGWHEEGYMPLENYLSNLAGFDMALINRPAEWSSGVFDQHGFLIQQFTRMLGMFNDTYGHVFSRGNGDIDMQDILHNDRMLAVLIPALELSDHEAATLGKLYISDMRMNIAQALGGNLEGKPEHNSSVKRFKSPFPFLLKFDEVGYYFAEGMDKMAAQFRSLCFMMILLGQDVQAMMRRGNGQFDSVNANLGTKWFLKTEDTKDTLGNAQSAAGKGFYGEQVRMERAGVLNQRYQDTDDVQIHERDNIDLQELKALGPGEGILVFEDNIVRCSSIHIPDDDKISRELGVRLNRFIPLRRPTFDDLCTEVPAAARRRPVSHDNINGILDICRWNAYGTPQGKLCTRLQDPTLSALAELSVTLDCYGRSDPEQRGIILFEATLSALKQNGARYRTEQTDRHIGVTRQQLDDASKANAITKAPAKNPQPQPDYSHMSPVPEDMYDMDERDQFGWVSDDQDISFS